jgi:hypothetical protein
MSGRLTGRYIFRVPMVIVFQRVFDSVQANALTLFVVVSLLSIPVSFLASYLVRLIP